MCKFPLFVVSLSFIFDDSASAQSKPLLQHAAPGRQIHPHRAASYTVLNNRMLLTSDWIALNSATPREFFHVAAFDAAEHENIDGVLGGPTDADPGCTGTIQAGSRWFFGLNFNNPFVSADLRTGPRGAGAACEAVSLSWWLQFGAAEPDRNFYIAIQTFEDMDVVGCGDDGSNSIDGVLYDFSDMQPDPFTFSWANISLNGTGLAHTMPADGVGGYQAILAVDFDPDTGYLELPMGIDESTQLGAVAQLMLWGTGDNEANYDGRRGSDIDGQFDDDNPTDGVHDLALECYSYQFGVCPDPLCPSVAFWMKDDPTACECDLNGDRVVTTEDLTIFLASFGTNAPNIPTPAADFDGSGIVEISDLALFLACFAYVCP